MLPQVKASEEPEIKTSVKVQAVTKGNNKLDDRAQRQLQNLFNRDYRQDQHGPRAPPPTVDIKTLLNAQPQNKDEQALEDDIMNL